MHKAFVHDRIIHLGGAEAVLMDLIREQLCTSSPQDTITIYTLYTNRTHIDIDGQSISIMSAVPRWILSVFQYIQHTHIPLLGSILRKLFDYRNFIVIAPLLTRILRKKIQQDTPDTLTISSFAAVKNIIPVGKKINIPITLYLHSPMQYIRENYDEYIKKMSARQRFIFVPLATRLRRRDQKPRAYDYILCNSSYTRTCALKYYGKDRMQHATVRYPRIHNLFLSTPPTHEVKEYYLYVGRLVRFVRETDLIIRLANEVNIPLLIMGSGPDEGALKALAGDTVQFVGQVHDPAEKIAIMQHARGLINLAKESCGMATMEALALGVPVLGYTAGATPELVGSHAGILAQSKDIPHLIDTFRTFHSMQRDRTVIKKKFLEKIGK